MCPLRCARTVSKLHPFELLGLLFERKQIPQIVVIARISRKTMESLEAAWGSLGRPGVSSTSRARAVVGSRTLAAHKSQPISLQVQEKARPAAPLALIEANQRWPEPLSIPPRGFIGRSARIEQRNLTQSPIRANIFWPIGAEEALLHNRTSGVGLGSIVEIANVMDGHHIDAPFHQRHFGHIGLPSSLES